MAIKVYVANVALILNRPDGQQYRVAAGEVVALTPAQYQDVAAYVTEASISDADLAPTGYQPAGETPPPSAPPEVPAEDTAKPRPRGKPADKTE